MSEQSHFLITGTRSGLGRLLAEDLLDKNNIVFGCSRNSSDLVHKNYFHYETDISDEKSVKALFRSIRKDFGRIDCVINNAGLASMNYAALTSSNEARKIFDTNFFGTFFVSKEAFKLMKRSQSGTIINISSIHTKFNITGTSIYGASKAAVEQFTNVFASETSESGITVNLLLLSVVENTGMAEALNSEIVEKILSKSKTGRLINVGEITEMILHLNSQEGRSISGQAFQIG